MGTCNFRTMQNFDLWAVAGSRFYDDETGEYNDVDEYFFYQDVRADLEEINAGLLFHDISIISGYYDGLQLFVDTTSDADAAGFGDDQYLFDTLRGPDNYNTRYYFDLCRSAAIRKYQAEQRKINRILAKLGRVYDFDKLGIVARFSNGETWYQKIS